MSIQNVIDRKEGKVGDRRKHTNGLYYVKARNGKWQLEISPGLVSKVRSLYVKEKINLREVGQRLGICHSTVSIIANANGFGSGKKDVIRANKNILEKYKKEITRMYVKQGMSFKEIADSLNTRWQLVGTYIKSLGIKRSQKEQNQLCTISRTQNGNDPRQRVLREQDVLKVGHRFKNFREYAKAVRKATSYVYYFWKNIVDPRLKRSKDFHLDHQLSIFEGYYEYDATKNKYVARRSPVPIVVMAHPANLKIMPGITNAKKCSSSHHTLEQLLRKIKQFERTYGNAYENIQ